MAEWHMRFRAAGVAFIGLAAVCSPSTARPVADDRVRDLRRSTMQRVHLPIVRRLAVADSVLRSTDDSDEKLTDSANVSAEGIANAPKAPPPQLIDDSASLPIDPTTGWPSRPPYVGENLGYSKEQSMLRLSPEVRKLLDAALVLYRVPGVLANRERTLELLGVRRVRRQFGMEPSLKNGPGTYSDYFEDGFFQRRGWSGSYGFDGWRHPWATQWHVHVEIDVDTNVECVDSRAVEGYLQLKLRQHLSGRSIPYSQREWARHQGFSQSNAAREGNLTPALGLTLLNGCLVSLSLGETFNYRDIDDANASE